MARLAKEPIQIPFNDKGEMVEYYAPWNAKTSVYTLVDNFEFDDTLEFQGFSYANTGSKFVFKSLETGKKYPMFPVEAEKSVPLMTKGILKGRFTFVKKQYFFGIRMVE